MPPVPTIVTVSLNPAVDRTIEVEQLVVGAHQPGREVRRTPGGKGVNVSRTLDRLGVRSVATGFLGQDNRGEFDVVFHKTLVSDQFFTLAGRTRENVTIADRSTHTETHIRDEGLGVGEADLQRLDRKLEMLAGEGSMILFSGSLPPGIRPRDFRQLVEDCLRAGARVAVDTSGPALRAVADLALWLVKPNAAELAELTGRELGDLDDQLAAARDLAGRIDVVLLTHGADGAYLFHAGGGWHAAVRIEPDRIRNTVGCGDTLLGAFAGAVCDGQAPEQAFARAVATATASATTDAPAEFDPDSLPTWRQQVTVTEL